MKAIFFPRKDYDVEVCAHRLGKKMTYTEQTDGLNFLTSYNQFMTLAKARGIKVGCFASYYELIEPTISTAVSDMEKGHLWLDEYSLCPSLWDKITSYQDPTEQEFKDAYKSELLPAFISAIGKKPVALSYSYGKEGFRDAVCPLYLGGRNSWYEGNTDYGVGHGTPSNQPYTFARFCSKTGTSRWYDEAKVNNNDFTGQLQIISAKIDETMLNGGWYNNFTHWHNYWQDGNEVWASVYLDLLAAKNVNNEIYFAGYGEAVAYMVYRSLITRAVMYAPINKQNRLIIRLACVNSLFVDFDLLQIPISIKFSTIGTPLEGQTITSDKNIISLGDEEYIVEIPYSNYPYAEIVRA